MNPCLCGYRGDRASDCRCGHAAVQKYLAKLSGPLLDRIDLHVTVSRVSFVELIESRTAGESSETIRTRVEDARVRQSTRLRGSVITTNAAIPRRTYAAFVRSTPRRWPCSKAP